MDSELLYGGAGDDTLVGNGGNDYLEGGQGDDTYLLQATGGIDTVADHSGSDRIRIDGALVSGVFRPAFDDGQVYHSADQAYELRPLPDGDWRLSVRDAGTGEYRAVADLDGWREGEFGLTKGAATTQDRAVLSYPVSTAYMNMDGSAASKGVQFDGGSKSDSFYGSGYSDAITTGGGLSNYVLANGGDDRVQGGDSRDFIRTGINGGSAAVSDNDLAFGGAQSDVLLGGAGSDQLWGDADDGGWEATGADSGERGDWLSGENGSDSLCGSRSSDVVFGGAGEDLLRGGAGDDLLLGDAQYSPFSRAVALSYTEGLTQSFRWDAATATLLRVPAGSYSGYPVMVASSSAFSWSWSVAADDYTLGTPAGFVSQQRLASGGGGDVLEGGAGNDWMAGQTGDDSLDGGDGDDILYGDDKDGSMALADQGNDVVLGGAGNDRLFGGGGDDYLDGEAGDDRLAGGAGDDTLHGGGGNDALDGGDGNDSLYGGDGGDTLDGGAGDDTLHGAAGDDRLTGGGGADSFLFGLGDGSDSVEDFTATATERDTIQFGAGVSAELLALAREGDDLRVTVGTGGDQLLVRGYFAQDADTGQGVQTLLFADNSGWTRDEVLARLNTPPVLAIPLPGQAAAEDQPFGFALAAGSFADADAGDTLAYTATLADGSALPGWLVFDPGSPGFAGTPAHADAGVLAVKVTATDRLGASATGTFTLTVEAVAPALALGGSARVDEGSAYALSISGTGPLADGPLVFYVDWGDGTAQTLDAATLATAGGMAGHVFADGDGTVRTVTVAAVDNDGDTTTQTQAVAVDDVAPTVALGGSGKVYQGVPYLLHLDAVADPGQDTVGGYTVSWGDGGSDTYTAAQVAAASGNVSHTYADGPALRHIAVALADEDGVHAAAGGKDIAVYGAVKVGDAPMPLTSATGWSDAWTAPGVSLSHKADYANAGEAWTPVKLTGLGATTLAGGDLYGGDLGVSGQSLPTGVARQEIDGTEALRFVLGQDAHEATFTFSRLLGHDGGLPDANEAGRLQAFKDGELVGEWVFQGDRADGQKQVAVAVGGGFDTLVLTAGAYDDAHHFVPGAYARDDGSFGGAPFMSGGSLRGSDYLVDVVLLGTSPETLA